MSSVRLPPDHIVPWTARLETLVRVALTQLSLPFMIGEIAAADTIGCWKVKVQLLIVSIEALKHCNISCDGRSLLLAASTSTHSLYIFPPPYSQQA